jgi:hypothetical protein
MASFWQVAPDRQLVPNLRTYRERVLEAIEKLAQFFVAKMEAYAKRNARWTDRTGAARAGLRAFAVRTATYVAIYLVTSVHYGLWLEVANGGRYAIIMRTLQAHHAEIMDAARRLVA